MNNTRLSKKMLEKVTGKSFLGTRKKIIGNAVGEGLAEKEEEQEELVEEAEKKKKEKDEKLKYGGNVNRSNTYNSFADDDKSLLSKKAKIRLRRRALLLLLKILPFLLLLLIIIFFIVILCGSFFGTSSGGSSVSIGRVGGIGAHFIPSEDGDASSVTFVDNEGDTDESTTYNINEFIAGAVYVKTGNGYSLDVYKVYAVLIRTTIMKDDDGVFESSDFEFVDVENSSNSDLILQAVLETESELLLDESYSLVDIDYSNNNCDSCTVFDGISLNLVNNLITNSGYDYIGVINAFYNDTASVTKIGSSSGDFDIKDTNYASELSNISLKEYLENHGSSIEEYNKYISDSVSRYYGTREGVVAAAVSFINFLYDKFNLKLPYYYGGKYAYVGVNENFGVYNPNDHGHLYDSFDCSGFVQWAVINGGFKDPSTGTANYAKITTDKCNIKASNCIGEIGDLINYSYYDSSGTYHGHVQLILSVEEESNIYYVAESTRRGDITGVIMTTREMHKGINDATVYVMHMKEYYEKNSLK